MTEITLAFTFADDDVPEGVDPAAWLAQLVADALRDGGRVEPAEIASR